MVCLGNKQRSFCCFWDCIQALHLGLFCRLWGLLHFFYEIPAYNSRYNIYLSKIHPFQSILVHWLLKCSHSLLPSPVWSLPICFFSWTWLEKATATHSSTLAWKIPWMEEPGRLQSMGSLGVGHYWVTSRSLFTFMHWRRKGQPTPVFLPGESQGWGILVGYRLWGHTELDTTEWLSSSSSNILGSYSILLFTASDLATITSHIHNW